MHAHDARPSEPLALSHAHRHGLAVSFDRAEEEEAADECPCDEEGKPKRQRTPPTIVKLTATETFNHVKAAIRVDDRSSGVRLHSHVRLQAASHPDRGWVSPPIVDGIAIQSLKGELKIEVQQPLPPEATRMSWKMYNAGSIGNLICFPSWGITLSMYLATAKAMMDALLRLATDGAESCLFHGHITGAEVVGDGGETAPQAGLAGTPIEGLNRSQSDAVHASDAPLSLIWGPPGAYNANNEAKILMTASTHNGNRGPLSPRCFLICSVAVDNVLERFVILNKKAHLLTEDQILRVATDQSKVSTVLWITMDSAQYRVVCPGAGLGILRKVDFEIALIDEASQITEPCALTPLVKGVKRAVLVGDHPARTACNFVQRFGTWRKHWSTCLYLRGCIRAKPPYDVPNNAGCTCWPIKYTFINLLRNKVQYRFPTELAAFPSAEFYEGKLQSAITNSQEVLGRLEGSSFPWPRRNGYIFPTVFIQCSTEEDLGGASKANTGQVEITKHVISLLTSCANDSEEDKARLHALKITALSPYSKQVKTQRRKPQNPRPGLSQWRYWDWWCSSRTPSLRSRRTSPSTGTLFLDYGTLPEQRPLYQSRSDRVQLSPARIPLERDINYDALTATKLKYLRCYSLHETTAKAFGLRMLDTVKTLVVVDVTSLPIHHTIRMYNADYRGPAFHRAHEWKRWWEDTGRAVELAIVYQSEGWNKWYGRAVEFPGSQVLSTQDQADTPTAVSHSVTWQA
ncbi:RNA-dependent RNA polymerase [Salix suchowensis]|nr:RNA-dependent RNA polymerase [Salix suchowensis]